MGHAEQKILSAKIQVVSQIFEFIKRCRQIVHESLMSRSFKSTLPVTFQNTRVNTCPLFSGVFKDFFSLSLAFQPVISQIIDAVIPVLRN